MSKKPIHVITTCQKGGMNMGVEAAAIKGVLEIDGEICFYKMSIGTTNLYKAESGKEYVISPSFGIISIADLLRLTSSHID